VTRIFRNAILTGAAALAAAAGGAWTTVPAAASTNGFYFNSGPTYHAYPIYHPHRYYTYHPYRTYGYRHHYRTYARADVSGYLWSPHRGFSVWVCHAPGHRP
jgi:hypothetical protein